MSDRRGTGRREGDATFVRITNEDIYMEIRAMRREMAELKTVKRVMYSGFSVVSGIIAFIAYHIFK
jgi:ribosomal protein L19E